MGNTLRRILESAFWNLDNVTAEPDDHRLNNESSTHNERNNAPLIHVIVDENTTTREPKITTLLDVQLNESHTSILLKLSAIVGEPLRSIENDLKAISDELTQTYNCLTLVNGKTSLEFANNRETSVYENQNNNELCLALSQIGIKSNDLDNLRKIIKTIEKIKDQVEYLKCEVNDAIAYIGMNKMKVATLQEHMIQLEKILSAKQRQVSFLKGLLRGKQDGRQSNAEETIQLLNNELRVSQENAAAFSNICRTLTTRCDEYGHTQDKLKRQLAACELECKNVNDLLYAISDERIMLLKKIEKLENHVNACTRRDVETIVTPATTKSESNTSEWF